MNLEIREEKDVAGRSVFRVWANGQPTSSYAYTEAKAQELLAATLVQLGMKVVTAPVKRLSSRTSSPRLIQAPAIIKPVGTPGRFPAGGVMLAKVWEQSDPTGWWMSEKFEGMRAYWTGSSLRSRENNEIMAPAWFLAALPTEALDGELFIGRGTFETLLSVVRKATPRDPRWAQVKFIVFDAPEAHGGCEERWAHLKSLVERSQAKHKNSPLVYTEQVKCKNLAHLKKMVAEIVEDEGEGVMLRKPGSPYQQTRSKYLLKVKHKQDAEAVVIGYERGKTSGAALGAYKARLVKTGVEFEVDARHLGGRRRADKLPIGTVITVEFQRLTGSGKPYSPRIKAVRDYE